MPRCKPARRSTPAQLALVGELAETILPRTDTPGALDAGVPAFIDRMLATWDTAEERDRFIRGLGEIETRLAGAASRDQVLSALDTATSPAHRERRGGMGAAQVDDGVRLLHVEAGPGGSPPHRDRAGTLRGLLAGGAMTVARQESWDAIVVGSGITGGWAAKELCEAGLRVLVLEAGRQHRARARLRGARAGLADALPGLG